VDALNEEHVFTAGQMVLVQFSYCFRSSNRGLLIHEGFSWSETNVDCCGHSPLGTCVTYYREGGGGDSECVTLLQKEIINAAPHVRGLFR
jgi:hypothetical protein